MTMLCSDDKHPDELLVGHINALVRRAVERGIDVYDALRAACITPVEHYELDVGQLRVGDPADFIEVDSLNGLQRAADVDRRPAGRRKRQDDDPARRAGSREQLRADDDCRRGHRRFGAGRFEISTASDRGARRAADHELGLTFPVQVINEAVHAQLDLDILKLVVVNRYYKAPPAIAFIKNFGLQRGAMASSVAHDSHNVIAVGADDADIAAAMNLVMEARRRFVGGVRRPSAWPKCCRCRWPG